MTDNLEEIRHWHKLSRDTTSRHWQHVDTLLGELDNTLSGYTKDDLECFVSDLESARDGIDEVVQSLRPAFKRKRFA